MQEAPHDANEGALTIAEFIQLYKIGQTKTYEEMNEGRLRAVKARGRTLIPKEAAREWLKNQPEYLMAK